MEAIAFLFTENVNTQDVKSCDNVVFWVESIKRKKQYSNKTPYIMRTSTLAWAI